LKRRDIAAKAVQHMRLTQRIVEIGSGAVDKKGFVRLTDALGDDLTAQAKNLLAEQGRA
jgi:hypothetical protein